MKTIVTKNEYKEIMKELANRIWKTDDSKNTYDEYNRILDEDYEVLPFEVKCKNKAIEKAINIFCDEDEIKEYKIIYRGSISKNEFLKYFNGETLYHEYYEMIQTDEENEIIYTYCEGDLTVESFNSKKDYLNGLKETKTFIKENL